MNNKNLIICTKICVDCVNNDPVDIRCGGPNFLGFDFFVKEELTEEMKKFITATLETFEVPLINIYVDGKIALNKTEIWTKKDIVQAIKDDAEYLQTEAARNYPYYRKR